MTFMKKAALASVIASFGTLAQADIVGVNIDAAYWQAGASGQYDIAGQTADLEESLGLEGDASFFVSAAVEHPIPLIPNIKVGYTGISQSGGGTLEGDFNRQTAGQAVSTEWQLDAVDGTLYYELLDNWVNVDAGLTIRALDSQMEIVSSAGTSLQEVQAVLPLVYGRAQFDLPFTGWSVGAEVNAISYAGDRVVDGMGYIQYEAIGVAHARAGYKTLDVSIEDSGQSIEGDISGAFVGIGLDF